MRNFASEQGTKVIDNGTLLLLFEMPGYTLSCQNQTYRALGNRATVQL